MSGQYFGERVDRSETVERTDLDIVEPVINSDRDADLAPEDVVLFPETPVDETLPAAAPVDDMAVQMAPQTEPIPQETPAGTNVGSGVALLDQEASQHFRTRWNEIQGQFVDEPRSAVQQADTLVSEVIDQITQMFANEHGSLESQWKQGNDVSTEDLRKALQHYRSFFNRLVV